MKRKKRPFSKKQAEFMRAFACYGDEIADNGNIMAETGWDRRELVQIGRGLVRRGILKYTPTQDLGFEGGIWSLSKETKAERRREEKRMKGKIDKDLVKRLLHADDVQPAECQKEVFKNGEQMLRLAGPRSWMIEGYVQAAAKKAGVPIDWHFAGGRAVVLALPKDAEKALAALQDLMPSFEEAAIQAKKRGDEGAYDVQILSWKGQRPPKPEEFPEGAIAWDPALNAYFMKEEK